MHATVRAACFGCATKNAPCGIGHAERYQARHEHANRYEGWGNPPHLLIVTPFLQNSVPPALPARLESGRLLPKQALVGLTPRLPRRSLL